MDIKRLSAQPDLSAASSSSEATAGGGGVPGRVVIYRVPDDIDDILTFLANLEAKGFRVEYRGEGMPTMYQKALLKVRAVKRKQPSKKVREELWKTLGEFVSYVGDGWTKQLRLITS